MVCVGATRSELGLFVLIALFAFSVGLRTNGNDDLHNQQVSIQEILGPSSLLVFLSLKLEILTCHWLLVVANLDLRAFKAP